MPARQLITRLQRLLQTSAKLEQSHPAAASVAGTGRDLLAKYVNMFIRRDPNKGAFGKAMAQRAQRHGVTTMLQDRIGDVAGSTWDKLKAPALSTIDSMKQLPPKFKGVLLNAGGNQGIPTNRGFKVIGSSSRADNKLLEARMLHRLGLGPETESLRAIVSKYGLNPRSPGYPQQLKAILDKRFGGRWIMRDTYGAASAANSLPTDKSLPEAIRLLRSRTADSRNALVTRRVEMKQVTGLEKWLQKKLWPEFDHSAKGNLEYRVHAIGGKIPAYGILGRGSMLRNLISLPTPNRAKVQAFAEEALRKLPRSKRMAAYGMDVGIGVDGKPFMIELNPSTYYHRVGKSLSRGASGYMERPDVADALAASVEGRTPYTQALLRAGGTAAGVGTVGTIGTGMALNSMDGQKQGAYHGLKTLVNINGI